MTSEKPVVREIVYLDRQRIESYLSQLRGNLIVGSSSTTGGEKGVSGRLGIKTPLAEVGLGADGSEHKASTVNQVPAHAILSDLEDLLEKHELIVDAGNALPLPGQIVRVRGDTTFESWELLASLTDSIQGVADFGVKVWGKTKGDIDQQLEAAIKRVKKSNGADSEAAAKVEALKPISILLTAIEDRYMGDIKKVIKLFFQDQNHVCVDVDERKYVGLLRRDSLVGSNMEELMFSYGTKPSASFDVLFLMAEYGGKGGGLSSEGVAERFSAFKDMSPSLSQIQSLIREVGGIVLEFAEELRRPGANVTAFMVPLAVCREIRPRASKETPLLPSES